MGSDPAEPSLTRMRAALNHLEAAVERRMRHDARRADADEEFALMQDDRSRLAVELDGALAANRNLLAAHQAAAKRVASAIETVEGLLGRATDKGA